MTTAAPSDDSVDGAADEKLPDIPTRRWAKTDARQQRILDAATEVFAARGFTAVTMADVVDHSAFDRQHAFDAYARGVPQADLANRRTAMVLATGDNPPGFDRVRRQRAFSPP